MKTIKLFTLSVMACLFTINSNAQSWVIGGNTVAKDTTLGTKNAFALKMITNNKERMRITSAGNVGIGTSTPTSLLSVVKTAGGATSDFRNTSIGPNISWVHFGATGDWYLRSAANHGNVILQDQSPTGNVGIGTTRPFRKLEVKDGDIRIKTTNTPRYLEFLDDASGNADYRFEHTSDGFGAYLYLNSSNDNFSSTSVPLARFSTSELSPYKFRVFGKSLGEAWVVSDARLKKDINNFGSALDIIKKLQPKTYLFKRDEYSVLNLPKEKQYGFVAQDLEQVLPELVTTSKEQLKMNANGKSMREELKTINYTELIPILTKAIQEQQSQIEELKNMLSKLSGSQATGQTNSEPTVILSDAKVDQNIPNPFTVTTSIPYNIPTGTKKAQLIITDITGKTIKQISLPSGGSGRLNIDAAALSNGAYNYSLFVDGKAIATKKMIVAK